MAASKQPDCRYETPPHSPSSCSAICLCRLPLPTRRHRARRPLVPTLRPVLPRCRGAARRACGVEVDHVTIYRWVQRFTPLLTDAARPSRHAVGDRWQVDETYVKGPGRWRYIFRAIDRFGQVIDVFVSRQRDAAAAHRFFQRAIGATKVSPVEVTTDQAPVYPAVLEKLLPAAWHRTDRYA